MSLPPELEERRRKVFVESQGLSHVSRIINQSSVTILAAMHLITSSLNPSICHFHHFHQR